LKEVGLAQVSIRFLKWLESNITPQRQPVVVSTTGPVTTVASAISPSMDLDSHPHHINQQDVPGSVFNIAEASTLLCPNVFDI
jgi:hypothetical protein